MALGLWIQLTTVYNIKKAEIQSSGIQMNGLPCDQHSKSDYKIIAVATERQAQ